MVSIQMQKRTKTDKNVEWDEPFWLAYKVMDRNYEETILWFDTPNHKFNGQKPSKLLFTVEGRMCLIEFLHQLLKSNRP